MFVSVQLKTIAFLIIWTPWIAPMNDSMDNSHAIATEGAKLFHLARQADFKHWLERFPRTNRPQNSKRIFWARVAIRVPKAKKARKWLA
jgi:hypothetical protein